VQVCGTVLVVDDDQPFRDLVSTLLVRARFVAAEASSGEEALRVARERHPNVVLLDIFLPDISGYELCRELKEEHGQAIAVFFLSGERTTASDRVAGFLLGADDYLTKPVDPGELVARIRRLVPMPGTEPQQTYAPAETDHNLTPRELAVLQLLAEGKRTREIAHELVISPKTVASHLQRVLTKLGVGNQAQAVAVAYRERLIQLPELETGNGRESSSLRA